MVGPLVPAVGPRTPREGLCSPWEARCVSTAGDLAARRTPYFPIVGSSSSDSLAAQKGTHRMGGSLSHVQTVFMLDLILNQGCGTVTFLGGSISGFGSGELFRLRLRRVKIFGGSGSGSGQNLPAPAPVSQNQEKSWTTMLFTGWFFLRAKSKQLLLYHKTRLLHKKIISS